MTTPQAGACICAGPTMDMQILRDLFGTCIEAATVATNEKVG